MHANPASQLATDYLQNGFAVVENAIPKAELDAIRYAAATIVNDFDPSQHSSVFSTLHEDRDRDRYFMESAESVHCFLEEGAVDEQGDLNRPKEKAINKIGHAMHDHIAEFAHFCRLPIFKHVLTEIGVSDPQLWQSMYIFKQPHIGGEVRWHQDASYLIADDPGVVGFWIAMEDADKTNSCLWMQPGGHRSPLREIYEVLPDADIGTLRPLDDTPWPDVSEATAMEVSAGSLVVFSDRVPHYSSQNTSEKTRQALTLHFTNSGSQWSKRNWLQRPNLAPFLLA